MPVVFAAFVSAAAGYLLLAAPQDSPGPAGLAVLLAALAILAGFLSYRAGHRRLLIELHRNILNAKEGILEPVTPVAARLGYVSRVVEDYNEMVTVLRTMFATVEECQSRVIDERNHINALLQSLPGALLKLDDNLTLQSVNRLATDMLSAGAEDLVGYNLFDVLEFGDDDRDLLRDVFLYKRPLHNQEVRVLVDGAERWLSLNVSFLNDREADMGAVVVVQDVTEYKQLQETVSHREKLVAMGQVAAGVSHELNTPLGNILGYAQLLESKADDPEKRAHYVAVIGEEARRCSRIVTDLLSFARRDKCDGDTCAVNGMVQEVVDSFATCRMRRQNIAAQVTLDPNSPLVEGSCGELEIVLTNLLLNAIQALAGRPNPAIHVTTGVTPSGIVSIAVADNGPGVPKELQRRIFEPFFTTKDVGSGSGLGLAIAQAMLAKRGGSLSLEGEHAPGACFVIRLPGYVEEKTTDE